VYRLKEKKYLVQKRELFAFVSQEQKSNASECMMIKITDGYANRLRQKNPLVPRRTSQSRPVLSVVVPAFNEGLRLPETLGRMEPLTKQFSIEIIVVCDGCTDNTRDIAIQWIDRLPLYVIAYPENRGKGYAVQQGILSARGQIIAFMDADGSTPPSELIRLAAPILLGDAGMVIGSRRAYGAILKKQPLHRRILGKLLSAAARGFLSLPYRDTQCGFKLFRREYALELFKDMQFTGFEFDLDILYRAHRKKIPIVETGIVWEDRRGSKVNPIRDGFRMLRSMILIKRQKQMQVPSGKNQIHVRDTSYSYVNASTN
jgi:glycosyltransferase involved in cell wall biosynthesis